MKASRLSVGAVNARTGRFACFDSAEIAIRRSKRWRERLAAAGFPAVEIEGEYYSDAKLLSSSACFTRPARCALGLSGILGALSGA